MTAAALITLCIILGAIILFATEIISIDLVAILIILSLVLTGVITPQEGIEGFSNKATITVAFMFALSAALLKTGALQYIAHRLSNVFRDNFKMGMALMMILIAFISAIINNTPVVAVFIPVVIQIAHSAGVSPAKMLIPLSFASIFGGMCTLIGTSTNILVSGIIEDAGLEPLSMFSLTPMGLILMSVGILYVIFIGLNLLPNRKVEKDLKTKFGVRDYLTEIELLENNSAIGKKIMESDLVKELEMDVIEVSRSENKFNQPSGDFVLKKNDILKVRCNIDKIKSLKDRSKIQLFAPVKIGDDDLTGTNSTLVEMVITSYSEIHNKTLKEVDFRKRYRAIPLAIKNRQEVQREHLYEVQLRSGDVILAEVKNNYIKKLKRMENEQDAPFVLLSEDPMIDFDKPQFFTVLGVILTAILLATFGVLDIMVGAIAAIAVLVLIRVISMEEVYEAINWKIVFLLAGSLTLGTAMQNTGLDKNIANVLINYVGQWGPIAVISALYLTTSVVTELMSNNAAAALLAPIALAIAYNMGMDPMPFIMAVTFAASACFMTPIGYQTNAMVYSAGQYRYLDFVKIGVALNIIFWLLATLCIPLFYGLS